MLFSSPEFIVFFLPAAVLLHFGIARRSPYGAVIATTVASLVFYLWWNPPFVLLPLLSIAANFLLARLLVASGEPTARRLLVGGIVANLLALGYFKYSAFIIAGISGAAMPTVRVPLALSFTTFVQIAFLVHAWQSRTVGRLGHYGLFVAFFPHLIAGPIVRWPELGAQIADLARYRVDWNNVALGLTLFTFGLAKKVVVADSLAGFAAPVFDAAAAGATVTMAAAWGGGVAYSAQLYFDFSGYSDMAVGLGLLFNFRLPINFAAPFRSTSVIDLWRRWHITLSRFLRDFVYVPIGGGRHGTVRQTVNLFATMVIGGLWHGAGWTFVAWGVFHGTLLAINHLWRRWRGAARHTIVRSFCGWLATFTAFVVGIVIFRAADLTTAGSLIQSMAGFATGTHAPPPIPGSEVSAIPYVQWLHPTIRSWFGPTWNMIGTFWTVGAMAIALLLPEPIELVRYHEGEPHSDWRRHGRRVVWKRSPAWLALASILVLAIVYQIDRVTVFLYYQF